MVTPFLYVKCLYLYTLKQMWFNSVSVLKPQRSCHEAVPPVPGWDLGSGEEVHHSGPGWYTCFYFGWSCTHTAGESRGAHGPELFPHHPEINCTHFTLLFSSRKSCWNPDFSRTHPDEANKDIWGLIFLWNILIWLLNAALSACRLSGFEFVYHYLIQFLGP